LLRMRRIGGWQKKALILSKRAVGERVKGRTAYDPAGKRPCYLHPRPPAFRSFTVGLSMTVAAPTLSKARDVMP
jgi:hypothetical protein